MRRSLVKFSNPIGKRAGTLSNPFSTSAPAGAGGRGRGRGSGVPVFDFVATTPGKPISDQNNEQQNDSPKIPSGAGHGRGRGVIGNNSVPSISSNPRKTVPNAGRGRGGGPTIPSQPDPQVSGPKKPVFFLRMEEEEKKVNTESGIPKTPNPMKKLEEDNLPSSILSVITGAGRGKPAPGGVSEGPIKQENRHIRAREAVPNVDARKGSTVTPGKKLSREDAVKNAMGILSRGDRSGGGREGVEVGGGRGGGGRGREGKWMRGRGGDRGRGWRTEEDKEEDYGGLYLGDDADGEKFAQRIGPQNMNKLVETFEEMSSAVLPSPADDAYIDAMHTNYMIECEPEYLMGDFESNPDIDEKPPIPLRDALEKMKPFLMAYENITSQEEWEEVMKETMAQVPLMKEIVDYYSGPDRVTAKQQQEELESVAKALPQSAPNSVKQFTDRAVLSLQSNPGWGYDKKCQFMDKLVWEVSQQYK